MARIFLVLAILSLSLLVANLVIGLSAGDYNGESRRLLRETGELRQKLDEQKRSDASQAELDATIEQIAELRRNFEPVRGRMRLHWGLGVVGVLGASLVNCISVTYFVGTSKWCQEVVDAYSLDQSLADRSIRLKRNSFRWACTAVVGLLCVVFLGAIADPGGFFHQHSANWVTPHFLAATLTTALTAWTFFVEVSNIGANYDAIQQILAEVRRVRAERGLDVAEPVGQRG